MILGGAATDIEEIGRRHAVELDNVHGRHGEAGAIDHAADRAVERDVIEIEFRRLDLLLVLFVQIAQRGDVGVAIERVVVEADLGIEADQLAGFGDDQWIDLEQTHVLGEKRRIKLRQHASGLFGEIGVQTEGLRESST